MNNTLRGTWTISVAFTGSYSIQVFGVSDLQITQNIYQLDFNSAIGYSEVEGKPIQGNPVITQLVHIIIYFMLLGEPLIVVLSALFGDSTVNITEVNVISDNGASSQPINDTSSVAQCCYAGVFVPPNESYVFQVIGVDSSGYTFSHFTDTAIQVSSVLLVLGKFGPSLQ